MPSFLPGPRAHDATAPARRARWARRARLALALPALALLGGACNDDDDDEVTGPRGADGRYALVAFQGQAVPLAADTPQGRLEIRGGTLSLDDGAYAVSFDIRLGGQTARGLDDEGTYARDGERVRFTSRTTGDRFDGTLAGRELAVDYDGIAYTFRRE